MKEISGWEVLDIMFKELNIEYCSIYDLNMWSRDYQGRFPGVYLDTTRDVMHSIPSYMYYWNYKDKRFYKQMSLKCPICDDNHFKYPLNDKYPKLEKYYKLQKIHEKTKYGKSESVE